MELHCNMTSIQKYLYENTSIIHIHNISLLQDAEKTMQTDFALLNWSLLMYLLCQYFTTYCNMV